MRIYLLADRTVLLVDDRRQTVTVEPKLSGKLYINKECFELEAEGSAVPVCKDESGTCRIKFKTKAGIVYKGERALLKDGVPYSVADYATGYIPLRLKMDELERQNNRLVADFHKLAAAIEPDALGIINIGGENK